MMDLHFTSLRAGEATSPAYVVNDAQVITTATLADDGVMDTQVGSLANNGAGSLSFRSDLSNKSNLPEQSRRSK